MEDDERAVPGELAVHVHAVHARRERALDGVEAVVGRVVAEAATTLVAIDYRADETVPVPEEWRERIEAYETRDFAAA